MFRRALVVLMLTSTLSLAQTGDAVRLYVSAHQRDILREYIELLSIPNVASDAAFRCLMGLSRRFRC